MAIDKNKALKPTTTRAKTSSRQLSSIIDGKEIHFNQTTSRVPLQPLIQSPAAVGSGHVYNFLNCNVVINHMPDRLTLRTQQAMMYNLSTTVFLASFEGFATLCIFA